MIFSSKNPLRRALRHLAGPLLLILLCVGLLLSGGPAVSQTLEPRETQVRWRVPESRWEKSWLTALYSRDFMAMTNQAIDWSAPPFQMAILDLDGKPGNPAIFVSWSHPLFCGTAACQVDVWYWDAPDNLAEGTYRKVFEAIVQGDFIAGPGVHMGMRDIWIGDTLFRWNGSSYAR
ncbi:hypothetical protein GCM10011316_23920 [Roseibium aquae]|uniref:Uncharacterized protein n=1 Tax=Roseibium aquae TaxID=1323746 RepID=A0A916TL46_9HYPH|nr:hypothetical protein [Roseibium aquae]GGB51068.1 hypothetical protein GCM10011316_23920 [Roseibium aquae]